MPAATREEQDVIALLRERFDGHCSAERVLSGPGLVNLYVALAELAGRGTADRESRGRHESREARRAAGAQDARRCSSRCSAPSPRDLAVTTGARGGVYIAGGIVPRVVEQLRQVGVSRALRSQGPLSRLSRGDPDARHHGAATGVSRPQVSARLPLTLRRLALGVLDAAALLGRLLVERLLNAFRAADRARHRIEHRLAPALRLLASRLGRLRAAAAADERERDQRPHNSTCVASDGPPAGAVRRNLAPAT